MGLREALPGINPVKLVWECIQDGDEKRRRLEARRRRRLYEDDVERVLREDLSTLVEDATKREKISAFAKVAGAISLYRRVINDVAGQWYAKPPLRRTDPDSDQEALHLLAEEARLDARWDKTARLVYAQNACGKVYRLVPRLGLVVHVVPVDSLTAIPDPEDPTRPIGIAIDRRVRVGNRWELHRLYMDDSLMFQLNENGAVVEMPGVGAFLTAQNGHPGIMPAQIIHLEERTDTLFNRTPGNDLEAGQGAISFAVANVLRIMKLQGHTQLAVNGDPAEFVKGQVIDPQLPFFAGAGNTITAIHNPTDPSGHLKVIESIGLAVAANHGLNRDRMNQKIEGQADMVGLLERREQGLKVFAAAEQVEFQIIRRLSQEHPDPEKRLAKETKLLVDYPELSHKVNRKELLEIWDKELRLGLRSVYDCIREDQPEIVTNEEAQAEILRNIESFAWLIEKLRALNVRTDADAAEPGNTPQANGANGQKVRDGEMTRDEAADEAEAGALPQ